MLMRTRNLLCAAGALGAMASAAIAGPLDTNRLPADSAWVVHIDFEQVRGSSAGRFLMSDASGMNLDEARAEMISEIGFDLFAEAMDMTMQGPANNDDTNVVIVLTATPAVDETLHYLAQEEPTYEMMLVDDYEFHTWQDDNSGSPMYLHVKETERGTRRQAVVSGSVSRLLLTLKTMQGDAPDATQVRDALLAINPKPGSLLFAQTASMEFMDELDLDERLTDGAGRVTFQVSEHDDLSRVDLACAADTEQRARTISEVVQGFVALGKLITSEDHDLEMLHHMLQAVRSDADGREVTLRFAIPSEQLEQMTPSEHDHHHDHGHDHGHEHDGHGPG